MLLTMSNLGGVQIIFIAAENCLLNVTNRWSVLSGFNTLFWVNGSKKRPPEVVFLFFQSNLRKTEKLTEILLLGKRILLTGKQEMWMSDKVKRKVQADFFLMSTH